MISKYSQQSIKNYDSNVEETRSQKRRQTSETSRYTCLRLKNRGPPWEVLGLSCCSSKDPKAIPTPPLCLPYKLLIFTASWLVSEEMSTQWNPKVHCESSGWKLWALLRKKADQELSQFFRCWSFWSTQQYMWPHNTFKFHNIDSLRK